jgi:hypothetical protein
VRLLVFRRVHGGDGGGFAGVMLGIIPRLLWWRLYCSASAAALMARSTFARVNKLTLIYNYYLVQKI